MKICDKCGALNSDNRAFCVDCNEKLGDSISQREQDRIKQSIDSSLDALYNDKDPLYVSRLDKLMGIISLIGALASVILLGVGLFFKRDFGFLWLGILFFVLAAVEAFFPKLTWTIEQLRLSFSISNSEDAEPSAFYKVCRKASIFLATIIGIVLLLTAVADFR